MQDWVVIAVQTECIYAILNRSYQYEDIEKEKHYKTKALVDTLDGSIELDFDKLFD